MGSRATSILSSGGTKEEGSRRAGDDDGQAAQQQSRRADAGTQGEKGKSDMGFCSTVCMFIYPSVLCVHIWLLLHICIRCLFPYPPVSISCNVM